MVLTVDPPADGPTVAYATAADCLAYSYLPAEVDPTVVALHLLNATKVLYRATALMYPGECVLKVRPVAKSWLADQPTSWWRNSGAVGGPAAWLDEGVWQNGPLFGPWANPLLPYDGGVRVPRVDLGCYPVTEITEVRIDGVPLAEPAYRLDNWQYLVRVDGEVWPVAQNVGLDDNEPGTWSIALKYGQPAPHDLIAACAQLGAELYKANTPGRDKTALPLHVTAITRTGVTYNLADVLDIVKGGDTGLYYVDLIVNSINPHKLDRPPRVLSPDIRPPRVVGSD